MMGPIADFTVSPEVVVTVTNSAPISQLGLVCELGVRVGLWLGLA